MKDFKDLKMAVAGTGYVGLSMATLLAPHHELTSSTIANRPFKTITSSSICARNPCD